MSIQVYSVGLCYLSLCAPSDATREDIEKHANAEHPTGLATRWAVSTDTTFANGTPMPSPCERGDGRLHYLLAC